MATAAPGPVASFGWMNGAAYPNGTDMGRMGGCSAASAANGQSRSRHARELPAGANLQLTSPRLRMTNSNRSWLKKNAAAISARVARRALACREDGSVVRINHETALAIMESAVRRHIQRSSRPTALRMTLDEAKTFPLFEPSPSGVPVVWLVVISDEEGSFAYALAQEGIAAIDPKTRAAAARAHAQFQACYRLLEGKFEVLDDMPQHRSLH
jgi:hypothetical protein